MVFYSTIWTDCWTSRDGEHRFSQKLNFFYIPSPVSWSIPKG